MSVRLLTLHAYRSWTEDNPCGYVQRGKAGVQRPNKGLAMFRAGIAKDPPVEFSNVQQCLLLDEVERIGGNLNAAIHAASSTPSHLHLLIAWNEHKSNAFRDENHLAERFKSVLGNKLSRQRGSTGNRWFSRGQDISPVRDREHFDYLLTTYLPKHIHQNGMFRIYDTREHHPEAPPVRVVQQTLTTWRAPCPDV